MNIRHVMEHHRIHFMNTHPPSSIAAINLLMPIYNELDTRLLEAEHIIQSAPENRWKVLTDQIQLCFLRIDNQWTDYMLQKRTELAQIHSRAVCALQHATEQVQALRIARMTCSSEANRIQPRNLAQLSAAIKSALENLQASFQVLVQAYPGADQP